ncbi:hypothetical protein GQ457_01G033450 [Hibiscus cannabinus]
MGDQKEQNDIKVSPAPIPAGWVLDTKLREDGTLVKHYLCPATDQHFYSYEDLMRYVRYAKEAKISIYSPNFEVNVKKEGHVTVKSEGHN